MPALPWPDLYDRIRPRLELKGNGQPDREGWVTARCIEPGAHRNGDQHHSLRINVRTGGVSCMSQGCISGNLNDLAGRLGIESKADNGRAGTLEDLGRPRKLPVDALRDTWGIQAEKDGWLIPVDDPAAHGFRRWKRYPWRAGAKYWWAPKGCPAADLVYNLSRVDAGIEDVFVAAD